MAGVRGVDVNIASIESQNFSVANQENQAIQQQGDQSLEALRKKDIKKAEENKATTATQTEKSTTATKEKEAIENKVQVTAYDTKDDQKVATDSLKSEGESLLGTAKQQRMDAKDAKNATELLNKLQKDPSFAKNFQKAITNKNVKLTPEQQSNLQEACVKNPQTANMGLANFNRVAQNADFSTAFSPTQAGELLSTMAKTPGAGSTAERLIKSDFLKNPNAPASLKRDVSNLAMKHARDGNTKAANDTANFADSKAFTMMPKGSAKFSLRPFADAKNSEGMQNMINFVNNPKVNNLAPTAMGKATEALAKAGGDNNAKTNLEKLIDTKEFKGMKAAQQTKTMATVGQAKSKDIAATTQALAQNLSSVRPPNINKFLSNVGNQLKTEGKADFSAAKSASRAGALPSMPTLQNLGEIDDPEARSKARASNTAKMMNFFKGVGLALNKYEKSLNSAKYLEDLNDLPKLPKSGSLQLPNESSLDPETLAFYNERAEAAEKRIKTYKEATKAAQRKLRTTRRPASATRAASTAKGARSTAPTPRYFKATAAQSKAATRAFFGGGGQAAANLSQLGGNLAGGAMATGGMPAMAGGINPASILDASGNIDLSKLQSVVNDITANVISQALGGVAGLGMVAEEAPAAPQAKVAKPMTNEWGIPVSTNSELGGSPRPVNEKSSPIGTASGTPVRSMAQLFDVEWTEVTPNERNCLKNLGYTREMWNSRQLAGARLPSTMTKTFNELTPIQRSSAKELGFTPQGWDNAVAQVKAAGPQTAASETSAAGEEVIVSGDNSATSNVGAGHRLLGGTSPLRNEATKNTNRFVASSEVMKPGAQEVPENKANDLLSSVLNKNKAASSSGSQEHPLADLLGQDWKELSVAQRSALSSLGWSPISWRQRQDHSKWPAAMNSNFVNLSPTQQLKLRELGVEEFGWDERVGAARSGENA